LTAKKKIETKHKTPIKNNIKKEMTPTATQPCKIKTSKAIWE
jgi:hypothetical protein